MKVESFHQKSLDQRAALVSREGTFLIKRYQSRCIGYLFHVRGIFAEVWYESLSQQVFLIRGFTEVAGLEPYLDFIDLENLPSI